mgnify:CR=1 FL=1|jgi:uncharacterized SAM-binding protein YcdF (DUF218 family)
MSDWITLSKLLPQLIYPFSLILWLLVLGFLFLLLRRGKLAGVCLSLALAILLVCGSPLSGEFLRRHEQQFLPVAIDQSPGADAIVLLGGDVGLPLKPRIESEIGGNRVVHAYRLYRAGKAELIVISGGNVFPQENLQGEAFYTAALLQDWGVPQNAILIEDKSRNTYENALNTKNLLNSRDIDTVLLVTSAFHMSRALATFKTAGLNAIPSPTGYSVVGYSRPKILDWIPSLQNLGRMQAVIREKLGILVYRFRGWIA